MEILIFKTNVTSRRKANKVEMLFRDVPTIKQWNFDLDDCDKVLRIEATVFTPALVESLLLTVGFNCFVLDY
jgi:hypothetical protein